MLQDITAVGLPIVTVASIVTAVLIMYMKLESKFSDVKKTIFERLEKLQETILDKLEYHERHDDQRFNAVTNDIWAIKVRNAAIDGQRAKNNGAP